MHGKTWARSPDSEGRKGRLQSLYQPHATPPPGVPGRVSATFASPGVSGAMSSHAPATPRPRGASSTSATFASPGVSGAMSSPAPATPRPRAGGNTSATYASPGVSGALAQTSSMRPRVRSPGGRLYEQEPTPARVGLRTRRDAAGYNNPSHSHTNMLSLWGTAALSPIPSSAARDTRSLRRHLMSPSRRYGTQDPDGADTGEIRGHKSGVLGHRPDASSDFNTVGHTRSRAENARHNRQASAYHGIESRGRSDASGASAPRYASPRPDRGSHASHWNRSHPAHAGRVPWHTYKPVSPS